MNIFKELEKIETLPVRHKRKICSFWYETYFSEKNATEWFNRNLNNFEYFFTIESGMCRISVHFTMWGQGDLIECRDKTTERACRKAITKFYKQYGLQRTNQKN